MWDSDFKSIFFIPQTAVSTCFRLPIPAISHLDILGLNLAKYENCLNFFASSITESIFWRKKNPEESEESSV